MRRIFLLIGLLTAFSISIFAKHIDQNTAIRAGQTFLQHSTKTLRLSTVSLDLVYKSMPSSGITTALPPQTTYFYVFNNGTNGFVIIAGDDNVTPVLGYSDESSFDPENIPHNMQKWLEGYKSQIRYVIENNIEATTEIRQEWHQLLSPSQPNLVARANSFIAPLITTKWDQSPYFNALCPYDNTENKRTVTGCVATAMAQVMKYWNHPTTGTGSHSYTHPTYGTLSANFGSTTYDWESMPNRVTSANNAVATLMYHCGVSVEMDYGVSASGANTLDVVDALKNYFGYSNSVEGKYRGNYTDAQ